MTCEWRGTISKAGPSSSRDPRPPLKASPAKPHFGWRDEQLYFNPDSAEPSMAYSQSGC
jgi:hypothetical protein